MSQKLWPVTSVLWPEPLNYRLIHFDGVSPQGEICGSRGRQPEDLRVFKETGGFNLWHSGHQPLTTSHFSRP